MAQGASPTAPTPCHPGVLPADSVFLTIKISIFISSQHLYYHPLTRVLTPSQPQRSSIFSPCSPVLPTEDFK